MNKINTKRRTKEVSLKKIIISFILYSFLFLTILMFLDYYDYYIINSTLLVIISLILGAISAYIHLKTKNKSQIDDIVDEL